jgi:hypothetical protein
VLATLGGLSTLEGAEPIPPQVDCITMGFGPAATAAFADPTAPWPASWRELLDDPRRGAVTGFGSAVALRCPEDSARAGADPLTNPSYELVKGLERDMPPFLIACHEREVFHVWSPSLRADEQKVRYASAWMFTVCGERVRFIRQIGTGEADADAGARVTVELQGLVRRNQDAIAFAIKARDQLKAGSDRARADIRGALRRAGAPRMRACAAWAAGAAGDRSIVPALHQALRSERSASVREEVARALALLGDRAGVPLLIAALEARNLAGAAPGDPAPPDVRRRRAYTALVQLAGRDLGDPARAPEALAAWKDWAAGR